jgi:TonB-linked SusC/RagA family outer membrane protein
MKKYLQLWATGQKVPGTQFWKYMLTALMIVLLGTVDALAQERAVSGTVKSSDDGEVLPGVSVLIKGTTNGTVTDSDGKFQISVSEDAVLVVSFVGFKNQEIQVGSRSTIDVTLEIDVTNLGEVVVIGYGEQRKVDLTGSVAIVDTEEMKKISNSNMSTMLQGKVASVQVTTDGQPGADPIVRIRGLSTFRSNDPLYVIDGVVMGYTIRDFSPNDIESIQILKDASAAAIYGSRAANGVIIITTKQGKKDQPMKIDYSGYYGVDQVQRNVYDVMDSYQYGEYVTMAYNNSNMDVPAGYDPANSKYIDPSKVNTNWFDEAFKTGIRQNHNINLSGGGANNTYNIGLDYYSQQGTIEGAGPNYDRYTARINNNFDVKFVKFKTGIVYSHSDQDNMALSNANEFVQGLYGAQFPVMASVSILQPTIKAYDESTWVLDDKISSASEYTYDSYGYGTYYDDVHGDLRVTNVLLTNNLLERNTKVDRFVGSGSAIVDLIDMVGTASTNHKFNYNLNLSYSKTIAKDFTFVPAFIQSTTNYLAKSNETLTEAYRNYTTSLIENFLSYDGKFGRNHLNAVVGYSFQRDLRHILTGKGVNMPEPYYLQVGNALETQSVTIDPEAEHVLTSTFGRVNYEFDEKYLLSATARYDGSSRLNPKDNQEWFYAGSAGWRIDRESFFPVDESTINLFKLRASYGILGNENIPDYGYMGTMQRGNYTYSFGNNKVIGSAISNYVNEDIRWEKKETVDVGLDVGLFSNQLEFTFDWYTATSHDLHYAVPVPSNAGVTNADVVMNAATMVNSGLEFTLTYHNDRHPVKFDVSANLSTLNNEVTKLGVNGEPITNGNSRTEVGREVGSFYGYVYEGIFQSQEQIDERVNSEGEYVNQPGAQPGDVAYADLNNDGEITNLDQTFLGSGIPKVSYGFNVRAEWKGFDVSVFAFGAANFNAVDFVDVTLRSSYGANNKSVDLLNAWTPENTNTGVPRVAYKTAGSITNDMFSQRFIQDASYLKIANVQLGYRFPDKLFGGYIRGLRIYAAGQNLAILSKYKGYNVDFAGGVFTPGFNYASYPTPRTITFGGSFSF